MKCLFRKSIPYLILVWQYEHSSPIIAISIIDFLIERFNKLWLYVDARGFTNYLTSFCPIMSLISLQPDQEGSFYQTLSTNISTVPTTITELRYAGNSVYGTNNIHIDFRNYQFLRLKELHIGKGGMQRLTSIHFTSRLACFSESYRNCIIRIVKKILMISSIFLLPRFTAVNICKIVW